MRHGINAAMAVVWGMLASGAGAQTTIDLRVQARDVDFSSATFTKPSKTGTTLPATCLVGETFFKTDAAAGQNWYGCTAPNVWTQQGGAPGNFLPAMSGNAGKALSTDGTNALWQAVGGDVSGALPSLSVSKIQGRNVAATAPADGQALTWSGAASRWEPGAAAIDLRVQNKDVDFSSATFTKPSKTGTTLPATCSVGETFFKTDAAAGQNWYGCTATNVWTQQGGAPGESLPAMSGNAGKVLSTDGTNALWQAVGGDVSGALPSLSVSKIQGRNVAATAPADGQALTWSGAAGRWEPGAAAIDLRVQNKDVDFSSATFTKPSKTGTTLPATCSVGETFFKTDAAAGQNWYGCTATNVWTQQGGAPGESLPAMSGNAGKVLSTDGADSLWQAVGGDVSGALSSLSVSRIQGRSVAATAPADGQALTWNAAAGRWEPGTAASPTTPNYSAPFVNQTTVTIPGTAHGMATSNLLIDCYDSATPARRVEPDSVTVHPSSFDVTVSFAAAQSGKCVVNGSGGGSGGGGSAVASVFGRTGAVSAQTGDYTFSQISGTITDGQVASGLSASKIGSGSVDNAKFGFLAAVTSDVQSQLNGKAAAVHTHTLSGDISGDAGSAKVERIQNRAISTAAPLDGQALVWSATANAWGPAAVSGGTGGGGASQAAQLRDLDVVETSPTVLTIGSTCSEATPCNVRFGNTVYSVTRSCTATLDAGSGTAYVYVASGGTLTIGHNLTVSASAGCMAQSGVTSFPSDSVPLWTWTANSGSWDASGGRDLRAWLSTKTLTAGTGVTTVDFAGRTVVGVDTALVPSYLTGSATLDFPPVANGACASDLTIPVPGAAVGDAVAPGWPGALDPGLVGMMRVSAANTVAVRLCNFSGGAIDPAGSGFRATIVRSF